MKLSKALQMDCPHKPNATDLLTGLSLAKCTGTSCMCWVVDTNIRYKDTEVLVGTNKDKEKFLAANPKFVFMASKYERLDSDNNKIYSFGFAIPDTAPRGYCTLRGKKK